MDLFGSQAHRVFLFGIFKKKNCSCLLNTINPDYSSDPQCYSGSWVKSVEEITSREILQEEFWAEMNEGLCLCSKVIKVKSVPGATGDT